MKKKGGPGFHVNTEAAPISLKLILQGAGLEAGPANGTCEADLLCTADIAGEVQKATAHLHSFVIPEETKCSQT